MKHVILLFIAALFSLQLSAQRMAVTNAILAHKDGDLATAKENIDKAVLDEKTKNEAKTWYYEGVIYGDIASSTKPQDKMLSATPLKIAVEAYQKAISLDKPGGDFAKQSTERMGNLWGTAINNGASKYNEQKYVEAIEDFQLAQIVKPEDTTAYIYSSACAEQAKRYDVAEKDYKKLVSIPNYPNKLEIYKYLLRIVKDIQKDDNKTLELLGQARKVYPNDKDLMMIELSTYLRLNRKDEAIAALNESAQKDPANAKLYYYNLGTIYSETKEEDKAVESYKKALESDPGYYEANYNLGIVYYNKATVFYKKVNDMDINAYNKSGKQTEEKGNAFARQALPYFEKAYGTKKDPDLGLVLKDIYRNLKMEAKLKAIDAQGK